MNTSIKVILYTSKVLKNGENPIMLRVIKDRKTKYISVGYSCHVDLWDSKENLPKKKHPFFKEISVLIDNKKLEAGKLVLDLENENKNLSAYEIQSKLKKEKSNNSSVLDYFEEVIKRLIASGQIKNADVYRDTKRNLSYFLESRKIQFSEIDVQFLNKFEEHLKNKGKGGNTIFIYMRTFRALINKAIKENVCSEKYYAFKSFSLAKYTKIKTAKRAIPKTDIDKIINLDLSENEKLIDAKNIFLFSYYCRGINFIDIALLKWSNIYQNQLSYVREKTKERFNLKLLLPAIEIVEYYKEYTFKNKDSYVFPILNENHNTPQSIYNRRQKMNGKINKDLKDIAKKAEIEAELTTYVARHSFATNLKKLGISTNVISQSLGHDSEKTTQIYLESFENSILDEASALLL
ncbi:MAG: site-specific integrase [Chitinophagales bacterium]